MTSEQPPRDALRPLPSIDIPLLREERSAVRSRRVVVAALVVGVAAIGVVSTLAFGLVNDTSDKSAATDEPASVDALAAPVEPTTPAIEAVPTPPVEDTKVAPAEIEAPPANTPEVAAAAVPAVSTTSAPAKRSEHAFGKAISFKHALENSAGLSGDESNALIEALTGVLDFRRSQPTDVLTVERDEQGKLSRFEYRSGLTLRYEAARQSNGTLKGRQIPVPIRVVRVSKGGLVEGSLGDALEGLSLGRTLAGVFAEVFEGKINFSTDTRSGDSFRIVLEEEYVGDTLLRVGNVRAIEYKGGRSGTLQAFWHEPKDGDGDFYDASGKAIHGGWLRTPLRYDHISSPFGMRFHPVLKRKQLHNGIDYAAGSGTPVRAAANGTVTFAGPKGPNGNLLSITHASGYETFYAHLLRFAPGIKKGAKVKQRQTIAYVGSTGRSTGPHLHFSLKRHGRFIDPMSQLNGPGLPMPQGELAEYRRQVRELTATLSRIQLQAPNRVATPKPATDPVDMGEEEL